ncbi:hypothetical protein RGQ13_12815 [Thalassotalea psychrophila]|uniref:Uncharacterized protein n=1 Tax=Thalassotalea psychrophila TaxID=3065647 RepID=A0ABY9TQL2_9GAMM|nr:hypothetical protein RGQ13_12815 [Colwelliaceae bacterium SQ149]
MYRHPPRVERDEGPTSVMLWVRKVPLTEVGKRRHSREGGNPLFRGFVP